MPLFQLPRKLIKELRQPFGTIVKGEDELAKEIKAKIIKPLFALATLVISCYKNRHCA